MQDMEEFCGNCKQSVSATNFATHSAFCERNIKICKFCEEPVRISEEQQHLEEKHITVSCSLCDIILEKWMLPHHQEKCPKRLVICEFCDVDFPFDEFAEHNEFCGSKTEKCFLCKKYVMVKEKKKHSELHSCQGRTLENGKREQAQNVINEFISPSSLSDKKVLKSKDVTLSTAAQKDFSKTDQSEDDFFVGAAAMMPGKSKKVLKLKDNTLSTEAQTDFSKTDHSENELFVGATAQFPDKSKELPEEDQTIKLCPVCNQACSADRISEHIKNCSENTFECPLCLEKMFERDKERHKASQCKILHQQTSPDMYECSFCDELMFEKDKACHESFYCPALFDINSLALYPMPDQRTSRKSYEDSQPEYSFEKCIYCGDQIMKILMLSHLESCKKTKKKCCIYCNQELKSSLEVHLNYCNKYLGTNKATNNKKDSKYKGAVPKHSGPVFKNKPAVAKCKYCTTTLNADILLYHETECVHQPIKCPCGNEIALVDIEKHKCKSPKGKEKRNRNNQKSGKYESSFSISRFLGLNNKEKSEGKTHDEFENDRNQLFESDMSNKFIPYDVNQEQLYFSEPSIDFVQIPCEFCNRVFPASDIVLHQTGCNKEVSFPKKESPKTVRKFSQNENISVPGGNQFFVDEKRFLPTAKYGRIKRPESEVKPGEFLSTYEERKSSTPEIELSKLQLMDKKSPYFNVTSMWNIDTQLENADSRIHPSDFDEKLSLDVKESEKKNSDELKKSSIDSDEEISNMIAFITEDEMFEKNDEKAAEATHLKFKEKTSDILDKHHSKSEKHKESFIERDTGTQYKYLPDFAKSTQEHPEAGIQQQFPNFRFGRHKVQGEVCHFKNEVKNLSLKQDIESSILQNREAQHKYLPEFTKSTNKYSDAEIKQQFASFRFGSHKVHNMQDEGNKNYVNDLRLKRDTGSLNDQSKETPYKKAYEYILNTSGENSSREITNKFLDYDKDHINIMEDSDVDGKKHLLKYDRASKRMEPVLKSSANNERGTSVNFPTDTSKSKDEMSEGFVHKEQLEIRISSKVTSVPDKAKEMSKYYTTCHICQGTIKWIDFNTHVASCATELGKCSRCGEDVPSADLKEHVLIKCPKIHKKTEPDLKKENVISRVNLYEQALKSLSVAPFQNDDARNRLKKSSDNVEEMDYTESSESDSASPVRKAFTIEPVQFSKSQSAINGGKLRIKEKCKAHERNNTMDSNNEDVEKWKKWRCENSSDSS